MGGMPKCGVVDLLVILSDPPYHIIARPGRELKNEELRVLARLFLEIDKISTLVVSSFLMVKLSVRILMQPSFREA